MESSARSRASMRGGTTARNATPQLTERRGSWLRWIALFGPADEGLFDNAMPVMATPTVRHHMKNKVDERLNTSPPLDDERIIVLAGVMAVEPVIDDPLRAITPGPDGLANAKDSSSLVNNISPERCEPVHSGSSAHPTQSGKPPTRPCTISTSPTSLRRKSSASTHKEVTRMTSLTTLPTAPFCAGLFIRRRSQ